MKRLMIIAALFLMGSTAVKAQGELQIGVGGGLPVGDISDFSSFVLDVDVNYLFAVSESFSAGPSVSYVHFFSDDIEIAGMTIETDDIQFVPIAGSGRYQIAPKVHLGADLGYAVGINDGNDGGFFYAPSASVDVKENIMLTLSYNGISASDGPDANWVAVEAFLTF